MKEYIKPVCYNILNDIVAATCIDIKSLVTKTSLGEVKEYFNFKATNTEFKTDDMGMSACKTDHWHAIYNGTESVTINGFTFTPGWWYDFCDETESGTTPNLDNFEGTICVCEAPGVNGNSN